MVLQNCDYPKIINFKVLLFKCCLPKQKSTTNKAYIFNALYLSSYKFIDVTKSFQLTHIHFESFPPGSSVRKYLSTGYFDLNFSLPIKLYIKEIYHIKGTITMLPLTFAPHIQHVIPTTAEQGLGYGNGSKLVR